MLMALLLASWLSPPEVAELTRDPGRSGNESGNVARTMSFDVGDASVTLTMDVGMVERPARVPLRLQARQRGETALKQPVVAVLCEDWTCALRTSHELPLDGSPIVLEAPLWPAGLQLRFLYEDEESYCCSGFGRPLHVVATTDPVGTQVELNVGVEGNVEGGLFMVPLGEQLQARPDLVDSFGAVIVGDDAPLDDALAHALEAFVLRGGLVSVPSSAEAAFGAKNMRALDNPVAGGRNVAIGGRAVNAVVPVGTRLLDSGEGTIILRPVGANSDERIAGVIAARPSLLSWVSNAGPTDSLAVRAAAAGLAVRPHRGVAFAIVLFVVAGIAASVQSARKRGWAFGLAASAALGVSGVAALWLLEVATIPGEVRERVVAWVGPGAAWEIGVEAARPRWPKEMTVSAPTPPIGLVLLGDETLPPRPVTYAIDGMGMEARARIGSASALGIMWQRPAPRARAVEVVDGVVTNHLTVPLRAVHVARGSSVALDIPAGGSRPLSEFESSEAWRSNLPGALSVTESRLLHEIIEACNTRTRAGTKEATGELCGAAVAELEDGTILGVEVSR